MKGQLCVNAINEAHADEDIEANVHGARIFSTIINGGHCGEYFTLVDTFF